MQNEQKPELCYRLEQAYSFTATGVPLGLVGAVVGGLVLGPVGAAVGACVGVGRGIIAVGRVSRYPSSLDRPWESHR